MEMDNRKDMNDVISHAEKDAVWELTEQGSTDLTTDSWELKRRLTDTANGGAESCCEGHRKSWPFPSIPLHCRLNVLMSKESKADL